MLWERPIPKLKPHIGMFKSNQITFIEVEEMEFHNPHELYSQQKHNFRVPEALG